MHILGLNIEIFYLKRGCSLNICMIWLFFTSLCRFLTQLDEWPTANCPHRHKISWCSLKSKGYKRDTFRAGFVFASSKDVICSEIWFHTRCRAVMDGVGVTVCHVLIGLSGKKKVLFELCYFSGLHVSYFCSLQLFKSKSCNGARSPYDCVQRAIGIANIYILYSVYETEKLFQRSLSPGTFCLFLPGPLAKCS